MPAWPALERPARLVGPVVLRSVDSLQASVRALRDATERRLPGHDDETLAALSVCFDCHSVVQVLRRATVVLARSAAPPLSWEDVGEALDLRSRQTTFARYGALDDAHAISALHEDSKQAAEVNDVSTAALVHASTTGRLTLLAAMSQAAETRRMDARRPRGRRGPRDRSQSWKELEKDPVVIAWMIELANRGLLPAGSEYYDPEDPDDGPR